MSGEGGEVSTKVLVDTKDVGTTDRRRRWPEALKRQIVAETRMPGSSVSIVARRHDVNANQVFRWRQLYEVGSSGSTTDFVPVSVRRLAAPVDGSIEIELVSGARVRIGGTVDGGVLRQVLEHLK
jgi:transposase